MDITPLIAEGSYILQGYGNGGFKVNGEVVKGNLLLLPSGVFPWPITTIETLTVESFQPLLQAKMGVDILLVGCGKKMAPLPAALKQQLKNYGIAVEVMDTGAACRTYNVLLSEGRNVAVAVVAVD